MVDHWLQKQKKKRETDDRDLDDDVEVEDEREEDDEDDILEEDRQFLTYYNSQLYLISNHDQSS